MSWAMMACALSGVSAIGILYPFRAPGDGFEASMLERVRAQILLVLSLLLLILFFWLHPFKDAALLVGLLGVGLSGAALCLIRALAPRTLLGVGMVAFVLALILGVAQC